jgi:hypothetical protein
VRGKTMVEATLGMLIRILVREMRMMMVVRSKAFFAGIG